MLIRNSVSRVVGCWFWLLEVQHNSIAPRSAWCPRGLAQKKAESASPWPSVNHKQPDKQGGCWGPRTANVYGIAERLHLSHFIPYTALASVPGQSHSLGQPELLGRGW